LQRGIEGDFLMQPGIIENLPRIVAEEFTFEFLHPLSEEKPLRSIAEWILDSRFIRPVEESVKAILDWIEDFQIDGGVSFTHLPC